MNCKYTSNHILDYHYGELEPAEAESFSRHLKTCSECARTLRELRSTSRLIGRTPPSRPGRPPSFPMTLNRTAQPAGRFHWIYGAVAAVLGLLVLASAANLHIRYDEAGFQLSMSLWPAAPAAEPEEQPPGETLLTDDRSGEWVRDIAGELAGELATEHGFLTDEQFRRLQQEQTEMMLEVVEASRQQHRQEMQQTMGDVLAAMEQNRLQDLRLVIQELDRLENRTDRQFTHTDELLYELIQNIAY